MKLIDILDQRFGRVVVLSKKAPRKNGGSSWLCLCDCGIRFIATGSNLRKGYTKSCGCLAKEWAISMGSNKEFIAVRAEKQVTHGHKRRNKISPEYRVWLGMKRRCYDKKYKDFSNWGGRGIYVCDEWLHDFKQFLSDMGPRPSGHSIDRLDPEKNYSPENCRWATPKQQGGENKRSNKLVTVENQTFNSYAEACRFFGVSQSVANMRMQSGVPPEIAVSYTGRMKSRRTKESYLPKNKR